MAVLLRGGRSVGRDRSVQGGGEAPRGLARVASAYRAIVACAGSVAVSRKACRGALVVGLHVGVQGECGRLRAVARSDLGVDVRDVAFDGVDADGQAARDLLVRRPGGDKPQDLAFAAGELGGAAVGEL